MSLKDALIKAGLSTAKTQNERQQKVKTKVEAHQEKRNFCEVCETTQPDVERFVHKSHRVEAEWICLNCADKNEIHDKFRKTAQSDFNRIGRYQRFYGPTEKIGGSEWNAKSGKAQRTNPQNNKKAEPKYIVDEDGEKNFNC